MAALYYFDIAFGIALGFFALLTIGGLGTILRLTNERTSYRLLPAGMLGGLMIYLFILNWLNKILPGLTGMLLSLTIFVVIIAICWYQIIKNRSDYKQFFSQLISFRELIIPAILTIFIVFVIYKKSINALPHGDVSLQASLAASFARGNIPLTTPWQPSLTPNYHVGAYLFEGALHRLSDLKLITTHALINIFFLSSAVLLALFWRWQTKLLANLWLIVGVTLTFFSFGILVWLWPTHLIDFSTLTQTSLVNILSTLSAKGTGGAAMVDLDSLNYLPARTLAIGLTLLWIYFSTLKWNSPTLKTISLIIVLTTIELVEESIFLPLFLTIATVWILAFIIPQLNQSLNRRHLFYVLAISGLLISLQGGFISDFLNSRDSSSFRLTLPLVNPAFFQKLTTLYFQPLPIAQSPYQYFWIFISPLLTIPLGFWLAWKTRKPILAGMILFGLYCFGLYLLIEHRWYPSNNIRFFNLGLMTVSLTLGYLAAELAKKVTFKKQLVLWVILTPLLLFPTVVPEISTQYHRLKLATSAQTFQAVLDQSVDQSPIAQTVLWAKHNLPPQAIVLYLSPTNPTNEGVIQLQQAGLYTFYGPQKVRAYHQEPGPEFTDAILTLNPRLLKSNQVTHLLVDTRAPEFKQLPHFRQQQLANPVLFRPLYSKELDATHSATIYQVMDSFYDLNDNYPNPTLEQLAQLIPPNARTFIAPYPEINFWYRMPLIYALRHTDLSRDLAQTDYMLIETDLPRRQTQANEINEYYLLGTNRQPDFPAIKIWSNIYASAWRRLTQESTSSARLSQL